MKNSLAIILVMTVILTGCGSKKDVTLYDHRTTPTDSIAPLGGATLTSTETGLRIHSSITNANSGVQIPGEWSLNECNALQFTLRNLSEGEYIQATVQLNAPGASLSKLENLFLQRVYVPAGETVTYTVELPSPLPHPEIRDDFQGMRRDPYYGWGDAFDLSLDRIVSASVYVRRPREVWDWELVEVKALGGHPGEPQSWMEMEKGEFFPFIDTYGQFKHNEWPGKIHSDEELVAARSAEAAELAANPGPEGRSCFGGWLDGPRLEGTGHFRVEKVDGKWWMVDPEGYLFWSHGVVRVTPSTGITPLDGRDFYFEDLPVADDAFAEFYHTHDELLRPYYTARNIERTYDFSAANIKRKYGDDWRTEWAEMAHQRLRSWGLNTIANSSERSICAMDITPYADRIEIKSLELESSTGMWWKFKDPFHPGFRADVRRQLIERKAQLDDPWCIGFFVDNEINWGQPETLGEWTLQCPSTQPAKVEMVGDLRRKYSTIAALNATWGSKFADWNALLISTEKPVEGAKQDCVDFSAKMTDAYFRFIRDEFKKIAPQKLYMGCRFAGSNENVLRIGAKYCDVISYNIYKRNLYRFTLPEGEGLDKPVMIGEFHFGATDRGMFHPGLIRVDSQIERGEAYLDYVISSLLHPNIIGTHWHQFSDQATTGRFDGENFQVGFTDICDTPYPETIAKIREVGYRMYEIRGGKAGH